MGSYYSALAIRKMSIYTDFYYTSDRKSRKILDSLQIFLRLIVAVTYPDQHSEGA